MTRTWSAAAVCVLALAVVSGSERQAPRAAAVTIHVAAERPTSAPAPAADDRGARKPVPISTLSFAPWVLEPGLSRADFDITANGLQAPVATCEPLTGPASLVVLVDASGSMEQTVPATWLQDVLVELIARTSQLGDRVIVGRVGGGATRFGPAFVSAAPAQKASLRDILKPTDADKAGLLSGLEASPIWDAVDQAVGVLKPVPGHRAIILFTDGRSSANSQSLAEVIQRSVAEGVSINVASTAVEEVIRQSGTTAARVRPGLLLEGMATATGGAFIQVWQRTVLARLAQDESTLKRAIAAVLARLIEEVHGGYALTFFPPPGDASVHTLKVRVTKPGLRIRAPSGYRSGPESR